MTYSPKSDGVAVRMEDIAKSFGGIAVLDDVHLEVMGGEVHALTGENGAGKSTLMKILAGIHRTDRGKIILNGVEMNIRSPREALSHGISMIHQELNPVRAMTVSENIVLGKEPCYRYLGVVNKRRQREVTSHLLDTMEIPVDPDATMGDLSVAEMQMVEIAKAVSYESQVIIMDEPTSAIAGKEIAKLFETIRTLKSKGIAIIFISHKMDEVFAIADTITVLRDGRHVATQPAGELGQDELVKLMVGRSINELFPRVETKKGSVSLEVQGLSRNGLFEDITFKAYQGEVLGFAGLMGAGRTEIVETVFGLRHADAGVIKIDGESVGIANPADAIRHGIALVADDRHLKGLNLKASVKENLTMVCLRQFSRFGQILQREKENRAVAEQITKFRIKANRQSQPVETLSGGNQQKVVLGKWLMCNPRIVILDEPTRGIDIGAKAEIYRIIMQLAEEGKTVIIVSSELTEIMEICDRVIVICRGRISGEFERKDFNQESIIKAAMGNSHANTGRGEIE